MSDRVLAQVSAGVLTMTLNRPDKRNAMDRAMIDALHVQLERADLDADVSVVVLRGGGPDFCAGADLQELLDSIDRSEAENAAEAAYLGAVFERLRALPKVTVALVQGRALAGGCGLATACDLVLAHEDATFGYPEIKRGFVPAMVMAMLRRAVGEKVAFDLVATGRLLTAAEATALGLVSRVLSRPSFEEEAGVIVRAIAEGSLSALAYTKKQLYTLDGLPFDEAIRLGAQTNAAARSTPDFAAAVSRFLQKS